MHEIADRSAAEEGKAASGDSAGRSGWVSLRAGLADLFLTVQLSQLVCNCSLVTYGNMPWQL